MIDSEAWQGLSCHASRVLIQIARKHNGYNNGELEYTYSEAEQIMHRNTFAQAITELVERGFIDIVRSGGLNKKKNLYKLSHRWKYFGTPRFKPGKRVVYNPTVQD